MQALKLESFMYRAIVRFATFIPLTAALICMLGTAAVLSRVHQVSAVPPAKGCASHQPAPQQKEKVTT